jgi:hypothetical protein
MCDSKCHLHWGVRFLWYLIFWLQGNIKVMVFGDVATCSLVDRYQCSATRWWVAEDEENKFYMFCTMHCSIIANENQQNAQMIYIFSVCSTYMFWSCLTIIRVHCYMVSNTVMCAFIHGVNVFRYILHNSTIVCTRVCTVWLSSRVPAWPPHSAHTRTQDILNNYTQVFNFNFNYQHTILLVFLNSEENSLFLKHGCISTRVNCVLSQKTVSWHLYNLQVLANERVWGIPVAEAAA